MMRSTRSSGAPASPSLLSAAAAVREAVRLGLGVALVSERSSAADVAAGRLHHLLAVRLEQPRRRVVADRLGQHESRQEACRRARVAEAIERQRECGLGIVAARVLKAEHLLYPRCLAAVARKGFYLRF